MILADTYDSRDYLYKSTLSPLPDSVDLREYTGTIEQQGGNSCTANATCSAQSPMDWTLEKIGTVKL